MAWWHSRPFYFSAHPFRYVIHGNSTQTYPLRVTPIPYLIDFSPPHLQNANICLLLFLLERESLPTYRHGRISAFMVRQSKWSGMIFRLVENPKFRPHHANSRRIFALTTNFGACASKPKLN
ncbi:hypothetical protein AVEN_187177-1 [Araneus ventricosus]|uniref:Uncharacterized protein n=1 Tax=Araneus ventricosus TaxID=182803 RepID=A0A4Y2JGJ2_ARAVE|nr:hypothetical protein AVEN_187177-1 [Araneus ventricosus]